MRILTFCFLLGALSCVQGCISRGSVDPRALHNREASKLVARYPIGRARVSDVVADLGACDRDTRRVLDLELTEGGPEVSGNRCAWVITVTKETGFDSSWLFGRNNPAFITSSDRTTDYYFNVGMRFAPSTGLADLIVIEHGVAQGVDRTIKFNRNGRRTFETPRYGRIVRIPVQEPAPVISP
jgi:hypothetical protein